jgi:hypothetical protein
MEPGDGARRQDGWWVWEPHVPPLPELVLAASGATVSGWTLCDAGGCREFGRKRQASLVLRPCTGVEAGKETGE